MVILLAIPVNIGRDEARDAAANELARPEYREAQPSLFDRGIEWFSDRLDSVPAPGGSLGIVVLIALLVVVAVIVRLRVGRTARAHRLDQPVFETTSESAQDYRQAAESAAAAGEFAGAVRDRFRAIVRALEELGVLEERAGRTADEAARDAGAMLPEFRGGLARAAVLFDGVHYGNRPADADEYQVVAELDSRLAGISAR